MNEQKTRKGGTRINASTRAKRSIEVRGEQRPGRGQRVKPPGSGGKSLTDAELLFRLRIVEACLLDGKRGGEVIEALKEAGRTVPLSTVNHYIVRIRDKWEQEDSLVRPIRRERQTRKLHDVARKLEALGAWGHWIAVQKLIADLEGNLAPVKVEHSKADPFEDWSLDELRSYIESKGESVPERFVSGSIATGKRASHEKSALQSALN